MRSLKSQMHFLPFYCSLNLHGLLGHYVEYFAAFLAYRSLKELRLLGRAVFIVDREGVIQYVQRLKENAEEPDYKPVLDAIHKLS